ncbi:MAG: 1-acyl-sn-glycerol-3-phosphate acyltransferase [Rikenellaceae bacterium]
MAQRIDLAKIIKAKNPKLAKLLPRFVIGWLNSLLKVKRNNHILENFGDFPPIEFIDSTLDYIGVKYEVYGVENIPEGTKILFAANHPLGGIDGMILATAIDKVRPGVKLIVNDILLNLEPLRPIFIGVNKHGAQRGSLSKQFEELYHSDAPIINFAAGLCSRMAKGGEITDTPWKTNFVNRCIATNRTVVPTYVEARNSKFFYRFARFRKKIGIKSNLEMLLLPRQIYYQEGRTVKIYFAEPVTLDNTISARKWCDDIRTRVYAQKQTK